MMTVQSETVSTGTARLDGVSLEEVKPLVESYLLDRAFDGSAHFHHDLADDGTLTSSLVIDRFVDE